jgi:dynein heavy chain
MDVATNWVLFFVWAAHHSAGFAPFSIRQLLQFDLLEQLDKLQVVGAAASKEAGLEKALSKMQSDWDGVAFRVVEYKDTGTFVIGGTDEVQVSANAV